MKNWMDKLTNDQIVHLHSDVLPEGKILTSDEKWNFFLETITWQRKMDAENATKGMHIRCCWDCDQIAKALNI